MTFFNEYPLYVIQSNTTGVALLCCVQSGTPRQLNLYFPEIRTANNVSFDNRQATSLKFGHKLKF